MKILKWLAIVAVVLIVLTVFKNAIVGAVISGVGSKAAHVPVKIGSTRASLIRSTINLSNLRVLNPRGFSDKTMVDMPQVWIDFEPMDLLKGTAHFKEVRLDLKELTVVKNKDGHLNVDAVKPAPGDKKEADKGKKTKLMIDKLTLSIGRVVYKDYSGGGEPSVQVFDINIKDRSYSHIDNPTSLVSLIMFEALARTTLSKLAGLDLSMFKDGAVGAVTDGLDTVLTEGANALENTAKGLSGLFN